MTSIVQTKGQNFFPFLKLTNMTELHYSSNYNIEKDKVTKVNSDVLLQYPMNGCSQNVQRGSISILTSSNVILRYIIYTYSSKD